MTYTLLSHGIVLGETELEMARGACGVLRPTAAAANRPSRTSGVGSSRSGRSIAMATPTPSNGGPRWASHFKMRPGRP
jgi:hypothetical protein